MLCTVRVQQLIGLSIQSTSNIVLLTHRTPSILYPVPCILHPSTQIAAMEISTENISSTVTNAKEGSLKLIRLLSPPSCPMSEGQQPTRMMAQTLLDLQIYGYQSTTTLVAAWRWHWVESSEAEDRITVTKNGLSSYVFTPHTSASVLRAGMEVMMDCDGTSSILWGERHCVKEDLALCKLLTDVSHSTSGIQTGEAILIQKLKVVIT